MYHPYLPPNVPDPGYPQEPLPQPPPPPSPEEEEEDVEEEPTVVAKLVPAEAVEQPVSEMQQSKPTNKSELREEDFNTFQYWRVPVAELDLSDTLPPPAPIQQPSSAQSEAHCDVGPFLYSQLFCV
jgi:hypothetical protein